jgi:hypothetical protein
MTIKDHCKQHVTLVGIIVNNISTIIDLCKQNCTIKDYCNNM